MKRSVIQLRGETVGAFIDAVYAIAVTILALELPSQLPDGAFGFELFIDVLIEYAVAFILLFAFWLQHRRINGLVEWVERTGFLVNAVVLMLVCLVPRATKLVFEHGGDVTMAQLRGTLLEGRGWTEAELVDLFYVIVVVLIDLGLLLLLRINRDESEGEELVRLRVSKRTVTGLLLIVTLTSFVLPVENRYFLLVIPVVLFFEQELSRLLPGGAGGRPRAAG